MRFHLFPFRTEKLSSLAPMVLRFSRGRVGSRLFKPNQTGLAFSFIVYSHSIAAKPWFRVWLKGRQTLFFFEERCAIGVSELNTLYNRERLCKPSAECIWECTMPRCSQSKRHNGAAGSCRKLSSLTPISFCRHHCVTYPPNPLSVKGAYCWESYPSRLKSIYVTHPLNPPPVRGTCFVGICELNTQWSRRLVP